MRKHAIDREKSHANMNVLKFYNLAFSGYETWRKGGGGRMKCRAVERINEQRR